MGPQYSKLMTFSNAKEVFKNTKNSKSGMVSKSKNIWKSAFLGVWYQFSPPEGHLTLKLWVPLNLACQDASFGTFQCQIRPMVMEIFKSKYKNVKKTVKKIFWFQFSPLEGQLTPK